MLRCLPLVLVLSACQVKSECRLPDFCDDMAAFLFTRTAHARFLVVSNFGSNYLSLFRVDDQTGGLSPVQTQTVSASPERVTFDTGGGLMYAGDATGVRTFSLDGNSGGFAQIQNVTGGGSFGQPLLDDSGQLHVLQSGGFLSAYSRSSAGTLTQIGANTATAIGGQLPVYGVRKAFLYVANTSSAAVQMHSVSASGLGGAVTYNAPNTNAQGLKMLGSGKVLYMTHGGLASVTVAAIDQTSGQLSTLQSATGVSNPNAIELDPEERFAYVNNLSGSTISVFAIASDGTLTLSQQAASSANPARVSFHPTLAVAYVPDVSLGTLAVYSRDRATGGLSLLQTVPTGTSSAGLGNPYAVIEPRGRFLYLSNSVSNNLNVYRIDAAGQLTEVQTVTGLLQPRPASLAVYYDF
jgi:6-phosphogluconolactonase (cycloisomerase 2 family)